MTIDDYLIPLLEETEIAHHIPGRIRLRFNNTILTMLPKPNGIDKEIQKIADQIEAIKDVRLNLYAGSVVVQYDTDLLPPCFWQQVVEEKDLGRLREMVRTLLPDLKF